MSSNYTLHPPRELDPYQMCDEVRLHHDRACEIRKQIDETEEERRCPTRVVRGGLFVRRADKETAAIDAKLARLQQEYREAQRLEVEAVEQFYRSESVQEEMRRSEEQARANAAAQMRGY